ncbi:hypothetical protein J4217_03235 [Candidatus Pacearchaeota archaeon]|nr:hypothetical protein [Candidatus Pacearchaeota archaeon]
MNYMQKTLKTLYENARDLTQIAVVTMGTIYFVGGCAHNVFTKTGHPSADIATGRSQPTRLERFIVKSITGQELTASKREDN